MKFHKNKLLTTVSAVALALAVGACSSNGDSDDSAQTAAETAREAALAALAKAQGVQTDVDLAAEELTAAQQQLKTAMDNLAIAEGMHGDLTETPDADLTAAQLELKTAQAEVATAMDNLAIAEGMHGDLTETPDADLTAAQLELKTAQAEVATAMDNLAIAEGMHGDLTETPDADLTAAQLELKTAQAEVATAMDNLAIAEGMQGDLTGTPDADLTAAQLELKTAHQAAESLRGQLAAANARIGSADDVDSLEGMLAAEQTEVMRLEGLIGDETDPADDSLKGQLAAANARIGSADDPDSLEGQLAAAKAQISNNDPDNLGLMQQLAAAKEALAKIEMETEAGRNAMTLAERIARESQIQTAISGSRVEMVAKPFPEGITSVTAARNPAGMVTVKVSEEDYTGGEVTAGPGDWNGATLTNGTNTLVVYTDIEAPADKLLTVQYDRGELDMALTFTDANDKRAGKAQSADFPSLPDTTWEYTGAAGGRAKTVNGTFDGVPGHFACGAVTCTLMTDADGKLMTAGDNEAWRFTPMAPLTATVKDPDAAYAYFGWWLDKPEVNTDVHMVEVFAGGTEMHAAGVANLIAGNVTYKGPAAGKYTTKTFTAGVQTDAGVGHFTASTTLTAKFLDEMQDGTIGGTVTGFVLDDDTSPAWSVKLEDAMLTTNQPTFTGVSEATFGPTAKVGGTWQGSFYNDADAMDATAPGTVAGTFDAVSENATLIGGFGATKQ